jgi:serine/threonine protein phosphatase 1
MVLKRWFARRGDDDVPPARVPEGMRIYAVGDVHGRADLLADLLRRIESDRAGFGGRVTLVMLGDYTDRGMQSRRVIELLLGPPLRDADAVFLRGNHDQAMLDFLDDPAVGPDWFGFGGDATVLSYGVRVPAELVGMARFEHIRERLLETVPPSHRAFLESRWTRRIPTT